MGVCDSSNEGKQKNNKKRNQPGGKGHSTQNKKTKLVEADLDESRNISEQDIDERESILRQGQTKELQRMIQNYSNLTLDNMVISLEGQYYDQTTISHANGDLVIKDSRINAPDFTWAGITTSSEVGGAAFSVGTFSSYLQAGTTVT